MKIKILTPIMFAVVAIVSCSEDSMTDLYSPAEPASQPACTMTVVATKGEVTNGNSSTRALAESTDGNRLTATWTAGDKVEVWTSDETEKYGELTAQSSGTTTTLSGTLNTKPSDGQKLLLKYLSPDYSSQDGTLTGRPTSIDKVCDYAIADLFVTVDGESVTGTTSLFTNQQAIVKFTLRNKANSAALNVTKLFVNVAGTIYTVTPPAATSELYVALPAMSNQQVTLTAQAGSAYYDCVSPASPYIRFVEGQFHHVTAKLDEAKPMAQADATSIGRVIGLDGNMYANVASAVNAGTLASAIVAYAGSETGETQNHGLAIAMKNAGGGGKNQWSNQPYPGYNTTYNANQYASLAAAIAAKESGSANCTGKTDATTWPAFYHAMNNTITVSDGITRSAPESGTSGWFLPSLYQWNLIVKGLTGKTADLTTSANDDYKAEKLNAKITAVGGEGLVSYYYWSSTEQNVASAWALRLIEGYAERMGMVTSLNFRAVFAF